MGFKIGRWGRRITEARKCDWYDSVPVPHEDVCDFLVNLAALPASSYQNKIGIILVPFVGSATLGQTDRFVCCRIAMADGFATNFRRFIGRSSKSVVSFNFIVLQKRTVSAALSSCENRGYPNNNCCFSVDPKVGYFELLR